MKAIHLAWSLIGLVAAFCYALGATMGMPASDDEFRVRAVLVGLTAVCTACAVVLAFTLAGMAP